MKRRSFLTLALACLGLKLKAKPPTPPFGEVPATWTMLSPDFIGLEHFGPPEEIRMDQAGDFAREQLARELWNTTRGHWEL